MSITFACPECQAKIEVGDEFAGMAGQCPRCQNVITIPSPSQPPPKPTPPVVALPAPARDRWDDDRPRSRRHEDDRPRRRRLPTPPRQPSGPVWPWVIGVSGAIVVVLLLFISFIVLVSYRPLPPSRPVIVDMQQGVNGQGNGVTVGRLEGNRAILQDGVFQIRTQLNLNDPIERNARAKRFEVQFANNMNYFIEVQSPHIDPEIRLEDRNGVFIKQHFGVHGPGVASMPYLSRFGQQPLVVVVTDRNLDVGEFTLTIREANRPRP
jgi:hypothetical protein